MSIISGKDGAVKVGATSNAAVGQVDSWTVNDTGDEFVLQPLGQAYKGRAVGQTDWTATIEVNMDHSDTQLSSLLTFGAAATLYLYTTSSTSKGKTGAGVITNVTYTVTGTAPTKASITVGGNGALASIS